MLNGLIAWSARNRLVVLLLAICLIVAGFMHTAQTDIDVLPEFAPPFVIVQTEAPGMVAEQVEALVSVPLESALNGTPGVTLVKSVSQIGVSQISVIFKYGTDPYLARQLVNEKLQLAMQRLPRDVETPAMLPVMSAVGDVLKIGLTSTRTTPMELRTIADWDIKNRLLAVPGVARVIVMGGQEKQFLVSVDPEKLKSFHVTLAQVRTAVEQANVVLPSGYIVSSDKQFSIRGGGRIASISDLRNSVVVSREGTPVLLRHLATVAVAPAFKIGDAVINGEPGVELIISKQPGVNTLDVTKRIDAALADLKGGLPEDIKFHQLFRQATFIEKAIGNVLGAIATGGVLVVIVLLFFLFNWRTAFISLTAIPLSLLSAILVIEAMGGTINTMTLGGLAIAVGEVVDDAIVDVEAVYRRLREARLRGDRLSPLKVIVDACSEVRSSVVYATFVVALVFVPVFFLSGTEGRIFSPLGVSYVVATVSSLLVALTVTPAMCALLLGSDRYIPREEPPVTRAVRQAYASILGRVLTFPRLVTAAAVIVFIASIALLPSMGQTFLPDFREDNLIISTVGLPGQSLEATTRMGIAVEKELLKHSDVVSVGQRAGRAELDDDAGGPNFSEFDVQLKEDKRSLTNILADIRTHMAELPGLAFDVGSFIEHRMDDVLSGGTRAAIAVKIFGPDLKTLRRLADEVAAQMKTVPGAVDVRPEAQVLVPEIVVRINRENASRYGLTSYDFARDLETAFNGATVSQILDDGKLFGLKVMLNEESRHNIDLLKRTLFTTPTNVTVPLSMVADISIGESPNAVIREHVSRRIVVQSNTSGRDVVSIVNAARALIEKNVTLPDGYHIEYAGEYAAHREASRQLFSLSLLVLFGILILLRQGLGSWRAAVLVVSNLPMAMIGGIVAVSLTGNVLSIGSLIGFISLFGISTRNSLLMVTSINHLRDQGVPYEEAVFTGALERVSAVLMTALTAALGMLPLAIMGGSGRELEQPLAVVIVGGMVSSTALTLLVIPALFQMFRPSILEVSKSTVQRSDLLR